MSSRDNHENKYTCRYITHNGKTLCATDWAKEVGARKDQIYRGLNLGIPTKDLLQPTAKLRDVLRLWNLDKRLRSKD